MIRLPTNTIWKQGNRGDRLGDLWSSYNLDLSLKWATLRPSPRMLLNVNSTTLANLGVPCAFRFFTSVTPDTWAIAGARMFVAASGGPNTTFAQDATSGTPTALNSDSSDMEVFNSFLYVSGASTSLFKLSSSNTWSTITTKVANSSGLHQMSYLRTQNRLYFVDDNSAGIGSINTSDTAATLGNQYTLNDLVEGAGVNFGSMISWIKATSTRIFIGTINRSGSQSKIYSWDGSTAAGPNEFYMIEASGSLACVIKDDVPVVMDTRGRLLQFNGGTFLELDRLPFENQTPRTSDANATDRLVHYNGMCLSDGKINILCNTSLYDTNSTNKENIPSGIWEYTKETGLYHKASLGHTTSAGTIVDYGQQKLSEVGALFELEMPSASITQGTVNGKLLAGATYYTDATTTLKGIFYDDTADTLQKACYFVTSKIFSPNIKDAWQEMTLRFRKLQTSTNKIVVKYRTDEDASSEYTMTWTSTTTLTIATTDNLNSKTGQELEILQGVGAGRTMHITNIAFDSGTYTITVDETVTGATGTGKLRLQSWIKIGSQTDQIFEWKNFAPKKESTSVWIQYKVWILSTGKDEIYDLTQNNAKFQ